MGSSPFQMENLDREPLVLFLNFCEKLDFFFFFPNSRKTQRQFWECKPLPISRKSIPREWDNPLSMWDYSHPSQSRINGFKGMQFPGIFRGFKKIGIRGIKATKRGGFPKDLGASQIPDFAGSCSQRSQKHSKPSLPSQNQNKFGIPSPRNVRLATGSLCLSRFSRLGSWEALWSRQRSMAGIGKNRDREKPGSGKAGMGKSRDKDPLPHPIPTPFSRSGPSRHGNAPGEAGRKPGWWEGELGLGEDGKGGSWE